MPKEKKKVKVVKVYEGKWIRTAADNLQRAIERQAEEGYRYVSHTSDADGSITAVFQLIE